MISGIFCKMRMRLTKSQKTMLALFLAVVALVIVLWVSGVFKTSSGFNNNKRSRFGAIGAQTYNSSSGTSGSARFDISYTNPLSFGTLEASSAGSTTGTLESKWNGLLLSVSSATAADLDLESTPNSNTATVALAASNLFYANRYINALTEYYGVYPVTSENENQLNENYTSFKGLGLKPKAALQAVLNTVLSSTLAEVVVDDISFSDYDLQEGEPEILKTEITRIIMFIATFRGSPTFSTSTPETNNYDSSPQGELGALEGVYVGDGGGQSVSLVTVKQSWLDFPPGAYKFGVGIINSNLTIDTPDKYIFPFMVSDMIESITGLGRTTTSDNPSVLRVSATYW